MTVVSGKARSMPAIAPDQVSSGERQGLPLGGRLILAYPVCCQYDESVTGLMGSHVQNVKSSMSPIDLRREPPLS
jgi:hypothetical protein